MSENKNCFDKNLRKYKYTYVNVCAKTSIVKNVYKDVSKQTYTDNKLSNQLCTY